MRRSPEEVHEQDGHSEPVVSCRLCASEAEVDRNAEQARAELVEESLTFLVGERGPEMWHADKTVAENLALDPRASRKRGECVEDGCTNNGTHRDGRCCGCHSRPGRTA